MNNKKSERGIVMREQWGFSCAREIIFGAKGIERLGRVVKKMGYRFPLVITDPGVKKAGLIDKVTAPLEAEGIEFGLFEEGEPEPAIEVVLKAYDWAKEKNHDVIIATGGGSVIDLGKAVSILLSFGGDIFDYFGEGKLPATPLPIIAIPTTSGTGSSVSPASVLTDNEANVKRGISDNRIRPAVALVNCTAWYGIFLFTPFHHVEQ